MTLPDTLLLVFAIWIAFNVLVLALGTLRYRLVSRARRADEAVRGDAEPRRLRDGAPAKWSANAERPARAVRARSLVL